MEEVWVIIPVHNRREVTRACLFHLSGLGLPEDFVICVVDDGCTDGTSEMLAAEFPGIRVVRGDGNLYWGGGIAAGMGAARDAGAGIHLWLNDDCQPARGSLELLVGRARETAGICGGICYDPDEPQRLTYAGTPLTPLPPPATADKSFPVPAESLNGNLVAIHSKVVDRLGLLPSGDLPHFGGDIVYTLHAHRLGIPVEIHPAAKALNRRDDPLKAVLASGSSRRLWRELRRTASPLHFRTYWFILKERFGMVAWFRWPAFFARMIRLNLKLLSGR
jgi:GT2 family glycosyltransferase